MKRITAKNISKDFKIGFKKRQTALTRLSSLLSGKIPKKTLHALKNVSFEINSGEIVGLIGKNGSGKSTLLRILAGIYSNYWGKIQVNGKIIPLILAIRKSEDNRMTLEESIYLWGALFGLSQKEIKRKLKSIIKFAELEDFANTQLYQFSVGMLQRYIFSIAIHCNPDILLLDEIFAIGDEDFKEKSINKVKELVKNGTSVLLVSHDLDIIKKYCDKVILMEKGKIIKEGKTKEIVEEYKKIN
jgi:ABC-type polysaccharide/polyol phosphate transport system ATPase subunit